MPKDDDIPSVRELEAREARERQDARDLLSGFDRPGRGPKQPPSGSDFVAHFTGKSKPKTRRPDGSREAATFVVPKKKRIAIWLPWIAAAFSMLALGFLVALVATREPTAVPKPLPSAATTLSSMTRLREEVPPPDPARTMDASEQTISVPVEPPRRPRPKGEPASKGVDGMYLRDF